MPMTVAFMHTRSSSEMGELFTAHGRLLENFTDIEHNDELELHLITLVYERSNSCKSAIKYLMRIKCYKGV